jgi:hypothetical protein
MTTRNEWRDHLLSVCGPVKTEGLPGSTAALRLVGLVLSNFYDAERDRLWCLISVISEKTGLSERHIGTLLATLATLGWIVLKRPKRGSKYFYELTFPDSAEQQFVPSDRAGTRVRPPAEQVFGGVRKSGSPEVRNTASPDSETPKDSEDSGGGAPPPVDPAAWRAPCPDCGCWTPCRPCRGRFGIPVAAEVPRDATADERTIGRPARVGDGGNGLSCPSCGCGMPAGRTVCETCEAVGGAAEAAS